MVLMRVVSPGTKNQVRIRRLLQLFESRLNLGPDIRHEPIGKGFESKFANRRSSEQLGRATRLCLASADSVAYHPVKLCSRIVFTEGKEGSTTTNFDIVGVCSQAQHSQGAAGGWLEPKPDHITAESTFAGIGVGVATWFQTFHGAVVWSNSSNRCLSLKVSMHCQKPLYL